MRLLERYALATGLKIGKQHLIERFFPLPFTRYITLHASSGMAGKNYPFYSAVVDLIKPLLTAQRIEIVQMGTKDDPAISGCYHIMGKDNVHQASYLIRGALLHLGNDSVWGHRAGHLGVPLVQPWGPTDPANHSSLEHDPAKTIFLESHRWGRHPTFASQENPLSIALIDPFDMARAVLKLLNIESTITQKTLNIGGAYTQPILELVPNVVPAPSFNPDLPLAVRMDLDHNEQILAQVLQSGRKVNIVAKNPVSLPLLAHFKDRVLSVNLEVDESTPREYVTQVKKLIKQHTFFTRSANEDVVARIRFAFFDVANIEQVADKTRGDLEKAIREYTNVLDYSLDLGVKSARLRFKAQKYVLSKGKIYLSMAHEKADLPMDGEGGDVFIDSDDLIRDLNHLWLYTS